MKVIRTVNDLKAWSAEVRAQGLSLGFVPTMGALHAGHMSLVNRAREENDRVAVSVFVNPTQFNNPTDLATYPRTEEADLALLEAAGVDVAFVPTVEEMYPEPDTRVFDLGPVAEVMEGAMRPGHFNGVAQVVSRLFDMVEPDKAFFGEKDFQQIAVIKAMMNKEGYDFPIVPCPIVREVDGLAMSSRNVRLSAAQREVAPAIHEALVASVDLFRQGLDLESVTDMVIEELDSYDEMEVEYFQIVDPDTLQPITTWDQSKDAPVGCIAVWLGDVRLIDNIKYTKE